MIIKKIDWDKTFALHQPQQQPFEQPQPKEIAQVQELKPVWKKNYFRQNEALVPESWTQDITELQTFFEKVTLPTETIQINKWTKIINAQEFVEAELTTVKLYNGIKNFLPALNRLKEFREYLTKN